MSSTLFNVLFAWKCSSTHHKLALDALHQIRGDAAENWRNLCLKNIEVYLDGSKAPDNTFKDFKNHVLHVRENYWGGAVAATQNWYDATVVALRARKWTDAVYAAGVLSHYYTDPIQPYHTGQCEAEGIVHRAAEWSIACAYRELTGILETDLGGWPEVEVPNSPDWLPRMVRAGADLANPHYEACIEHYDLKSGVKDPPRGLDQDMKDRIAKLIGYAVVGYARIMERALAESEASPPETGITLLGVMAQLTIPIFWVTKKLKDGKERAIVEATFNEFQATGKVIDTLSDDDYAIREIHAKEVLKKPLDELDAEKPTPVGAAHSDGTRLRARSAVPAKTDPPPPDTPAVPQHEVQRQAMTRPEPATVNSPVSMPVNSKPTESTSAKPEPAASPMPSKSPTQVPKVEPPVAERPPLSIRDSGIPAKSVGSGDQTCSSTGRMETQDRDRFHVDISMPIEKAPSIGTKTAAILERHGIVTVGDLLAVDPDRLAAKVNERHIDAYTILTWQMQADLCCSVPNLRGRDAQILTACGITLREELAAARTDALLTKVKSFVATPDGQRILRDGDRPDQKEVTHWIAWANQPERNRAA